MPQPPPYCGTAPTPAEILGRFNLDYRLMLVLAALVLWHMIALHAPAQRRARLLAGAGWLVASAALISPLCALSVALFSARVGQHMLLVLVAAPLIGTGLPLRAAAPASHGGGRTRVLWGSTGFFFAALWFWHMPVPYGATFASVAAYWAMHVTLFGSAILLWRELIHHPRRQTAQALAAGAITFVHMGLLGAILALSDRPLFAWHLLTTQTWGLTPLQDQQLGGALMWVPGIALFLWSALRSLSRLWRTLDSARAV